MPNKVGRVSFQSFTVFLLLPRYTGQQSGKRQDCKMLSLITILYLCLRQNYVMSHSRLAYDKLNHSERYDMLEA